MERDGRNAGVRQALALRLAAAAQGGVVIVAGPSGTGKTALVTAWTQAQRAAGLRVIWHSIGPSDRQPVSFVRALMLASAQAGLVPEILREGWGQPDDPAMLLNQLLYCLEAAPVVLVLDDYDLLDGYPSADSVLEQILRHKPAALGMIILARMPPPFPMLGTTEAGVISGSELLSTEEAQALIASQVVPAAGAGDLLAASAGIELPAESPTATRRPAQALTEDMSPELAVFLRQVTVLGPLAAEDADAILARTDSGRLFGEAVMRGPVQVDSLDRYQVAPGMATALSSLPDEPGLRTRAVSYWISQPRLAAAAAGLMGMEAPEELASLLIERGSTLCRTGRAEEFLAAVGALPAIKWPPALRSLYVEASLLVGQVGRARAALEMMGGVGGEASALRAELACVEGNLDLAIDLVSMPVNDTDPALRWRLKAAAVWAVAQQEGPIKAIQHLGDEESVIWTECALGSPCTVRIDLCLLAGRLGEAEKLLDRAEQAVSAARASDLRQWTLAELAIRRARWQRLCGAHTDARATAARAVILAGEVGHTRGRVSALLEVGWSALAAGRRREALESLAIVDQGLAALDDPSLAAGRRRLALAVALARYDRGMARALVGDGGAGGRLRQAQAGRERGHVALRRGCYGEAAVALEEAADRLAGLGVAIEAAECAILGAEAALALGQPQRASRLLAPLPGLVGVDAGNAGPAALAPTLAQAHRLRKNWRRLRRLNAAPASVLAGAERALVRAQGSGGPGLRLCPFGGVRAYLHGQPLADSTLPALAWEVLFFISEVHTGPGSGVPRAAILEAVGHGGQGAQARLWDASRHLRRLLGDRAWLAGGGSYRLAMSFVHEGALFGELSRLAQTTAGARQQSAAAKALAMAGQGAYLGWCASPWAVEARNAVDLQVDALRAVLQR